MHQLSSELMWMASNILAHLTSPSTLIIRKSNAEQRRFLDKGLALEDSIFERNKECRV